MRGSNYMASLTGKKFGILDRRLLTRDSRDLKIRRRQRELQKSNRFDWQKNNFARFFVHFFAVTARLRRENA